MIWLRATHAKVRHTFLAPMPDASWKSWRARCGTMTVMPETGRAHRRWRAKTSREDFEKTLRETAHTDGPKCKMCCKLLGNAT